jgi:hypothetical protein
MTFDALYQESPLPLVPLRRLLPAGRLLPGDWVEVRSGAEILATLDGEGTLDHLPFMPEMRSFIGRRFRVKARADRTIAEKRGLRRMSDTVHLDGVHCDGQAHDGCSRGCLVFWKEAWLRRVVGPHDAPPPADPARPFACKTKEGDGYFCQATQLHVASEPLRGRHLSRHFSALWNENVSPVTLGHSFVVTAHDTVQKRVLHGNVWDVVPGTCVRKTPAVSLNLKAGERVRVKSAREIRATLDEKGNNRGLEFSREMLRFCGQEFTVLQRCDRIIRDDPPKMSKMKDTVILEGLQYVALSCLAIPRGEYFFWRECWLERVGESAPA